jgi:hypothetical protein
MTYRSLFSTCCCPALQYCLYLAKAPSYDNPQFVLSLRPDVQYLPNMVR